MTTDQHILDAVLGYTLQFDAQPYQIIVPQPIKFGTQETAAIDAEIAKFVAKGIVEESVHEKGEFISRIFTRPKKNGNLRVILDLSRLNEFIEYHHFKMDTFESSLKLVTPNCYMASVDLQDAYFSVPISSFCCKFLKFLWRGTLYKFLVLPNGLSSGPRIFTKLMKPVFAFLRTKGYNIAGYIDDTLLIQDSCPAALAAVDDTVKLLQKLGFVVQTAKSVLSPVQEINYLGFTINSVKMKVMLPLAKKNELRSLCMKLYSKELCTIEELASIVGKIVATFSGAEFGPLHYRVLERAKTKALKENKGNFKAMVQLGQLELMELQWWIDNVKFVTDRLIMGL